jgi:aminodeoxyfutalosine deaminase
VPDLQTFIRGLPKAELHVHQLGSAPVPAVAELAQRHAGTTTVPADPAALADYFTFTDFAHFIEVYLAVVDLVRTPEDVADLTRLVLSGLVHQNVRYAEMTVTPYSSIRDRPDRPGIPAAEFCAAIEDARRRARAEDGLEVRWIFDIPGESGIPAAESTLAVALSGAADGLIGFGLGGPEIGVPRAQFAPYFAAARAAGLHSIPHAGESTGPETVWSAIQDLGAERIGHGINSVHDPALLAYLAEHGIVLEICPTSNVRTRSVTSLGGHPLPALVAAGVPVTINSDDPSMFSTTLNAEYAIAAELLSLDAVGIAGLAHAAVQASFADEPMRAELSAEIDAYVGGNA